MKKTTLKSIPNWVWLLVGIILIGIFVRAYHFRDWLQFSPDEARDATLISNALTGKAEFPRLGPQAGNTQFYLGPLYYQEEYVAAKLFGNSPEKIAYPDLFFSILAIPMLFFFLRKYFKQNIALLMTLILSLSYFAIEISRFASNPNSIPFFVILFLYGLLEMAEQKKKTKAIWPILVGVSMGVGFQLHALLFMILPVVALIACFYLIKKKSLTLRSFMLVLCFFLLVNAGQISEEIKSEGANIAHLFKGASSESNTGGGALVRNVGLIASCQIQANAHIVSSVVNVEKCGEIFNVSKSVRKIKGTTTKIVFGGSFVLMMVLSVIFSIGGYTLVWYYLKRERDEKKRDFLWLLVVYNFVSFLVLLPVASQISVRYYSILIFVPFVLAGLWLTFLFEKNKSKQAQIFYVVSAVFVFLNAAFLWQAAQPYVNKAASNMNSSVLGEINPMVQYMITSTPQNAEIRLDGQRMYFKRFYKPFNYIANKQGKEIISPENKKPFQAGSEFFYIDATSDVPYKVGEKIKGDTIKNLKQFQNITIYTMIKQ